MSSILGSLKRSKGETDRVNHEESYAGRTPVPTETRREAVPKGEKAETCQPEQVAGRFEWGVGPIV